MGCSPTNQASNQSKSDNQFQLIMLIRRLTISFQGQIKVLETVALSQKSKLKQQLKKGPGFRSSQAQRMMLEQILYKLHMKQIYELMVIQCNTIINRKDNFSAFNSTTSKDIYTQQKKELLKEPFRNILFAIPIINDDKASIKNADLQKLKLKILKFRQISEPEISNLDILNYYRVNARPNHQMINQYVLNLCTTEDINLQTFKCVGHAFGY